MSHDTSRKRQSEQQASALRVELDPDGQMDELFARNATVHIERMSDHHLWMRVNDQVVEVTSKRPLYITTEDDR